jgi:hypothetical protein
MGPSSGTLHSPTTAIAKGPLAMVDITVTSEIKNWGTGAFKIARPAHPTAPPKIISARARSIQEVPENQGSRIPAKQGGSLREITDIEIFANRPWRPVVSSDGVASEVVQLRPRIVR